MDANFKRKSDALSHKSHKKFKQEKNLGRLNQDTYEYFSRIAEVLKGEIDDEEKEILAKNTLEQTEGIEVDVCNHTVAASILERIIPYAPWSEIQRIADAMDQEMNRIKSSSESRVEEAIIKEAGNRIRTAEKEEKETCLHYLNNKSNQLLQNFENDIWNLNINFAARTCLTVCSGYDAKTNNKTAISKIIVKKFSKKLMKWPEIADNYYHESISGFLQILIYSLKAVSIKKCQKFVRFLMENCFMKNDDNLPDTVSVEYFEDVPWSRLLEAIIDVASPEIQEEIYQKIFLNHIGTLILSKKGHFAVCKLIKSCSNKITFANIVEGVKDKFIEIISANHFDILHALSDACVNTGEKQGEFLKNLTTAVGCSSPNKERYLFLCVISMKTCDEVSTEVDVNVNLHGSLIVQNIFKFKKPQKFIEAALSLNISTLKRILTDAKGCHVTDAFFDSSTVGAKSKDRLLNALKGHYIDLAVDKYGSRSFDVIWNYANQKQRTLIISELSRQVMKTSFGTIIALKIGLEKYIKDKCAWERAYNSTNKTNKFVDNKSRSF
uniref:Putative nucleolar protein 9 rhodnius neglectus n=1 Tax=Rhodnius prolixus TaxID=13249 RepID=A0A4P6D6J5_RHOPR